MRSIARTKEALKIVNHHQFRKYGWQSIFSDFLKMARCALSVGQMEPEYLQVAGKYEKEDLPLFANLLGTLITNVNPYEDIFGSLYEELLSSGKAKQLGQFFTPIHISDLLAQLVTDKGYCKTVHDPCVGSGRTLLSAAKALKPYQAKTWHYSGIDIDAMSVDMTICNMVLHQMNGWVIHGNSLSLEFMRGFKTTLHDSGVFVISEMDKQECEHCMMKSIEETKKKAVQASLFD